MGLSNLSSFFPLIVLLICISLMIKNVEHLSIHRLPNYDSIEKYLYRSFAHFELDYYHFLLSCLSSLYILDVNLLSDVFCTHFLPLHRLSFPSVDCFTLKSLICLELISATIEMVV
jgi:hypothetical protein